MGTDGSTGAKPKGRTRTRIRDSASPQATIKVDTGVLCMTTDPRTDLTTEE